MARLEPGAEVTVRWRSSISGKPIRFRAIYRGVSQDGALDLYRPHYGFAFAPADADVTVHRKSKFGTAESSS